MGGVTVRSAEIEQAILELLSSGESLNAICKTADIPVAESTVRKWVTEDADFGARYARARDIGLDCRADRIIEEARAATDASLGRLTFDADRWYLSKMAPKRYGDKQLIGSDPDNPLPSGGLDASKLSTDALREILAARGATDAG